MCRLGGKLHRRRKGDCPDMEHSVVSLLLTIDRKLDRLLSIIGSPPPGPATHAVLILTKSQGVNMAGQITVDTAAGEENATLAFVDDKGDTDAAAPAGAVVTFTSDNPSVATVATNADNALQGDITPVAEGTANIGATIADGSGNPIMEPDGLTPFSVSPVTVTVSAGGATGAELTLSV